MCGPMRIRVALVALVAVAASGCGGSDGGDLVTMQGRIIAPDDYCYLLSELNLENEQVQLLDESNKIIGTGKVEANLLEGFKGVEDIPSIALDIPPSCVMPFKISDVPKAKFYSVRVGDEASTAWSYEDLSENDFKPEMVIGTGSYSDSTREDFCDQMERLDASLQKPEEIKKDLGQSWDGWLATAQEVALGFQITRVLDGEVEADDPGMFDFALDLEAMKYAQWAGVTELNAAAAKVNPKAVALLEEFECDYEWSNSDYSAN